MLKFGWKAGAEQYPPVELLEHAIAADQAGFDLVDVSDHFHPWSQAGQAPFVWTWLGAAAARTSRWWRAGPVPLRSDRSARLVSWDVHAPGPGCSGR
jgi:hypothetical protein